MNLRVATFFILSAIAGSTTSSFAQQAQTGRAGGGPPAAAAAPLVIPQYGEPLALDRAQRVMVAAEREAKRLGVSPAIAVVDSTGHLIMFERLDNSDYGNGDIAVALAKSAVEFRRPTKEFGDTVANNPTIAFLPGVVPFQGGWPILVNGRLVGAIGVVGARGVPNAGNMVADAGINAGK